MDRFTQASTADAADGAAVHAATRALLHDAAQRAASYLESIDQRPVAPTAAAVAALLRLDGPLPAQGVDAQQTLQLIDRLGSPATFAMCRPALLRLRHRAARCPWRWRPTGWPAPGTRTAALAASRAGRGPLRAGGAGLAGRSCSVCRRGCAGAFVTGATVANFARWRRPATRCWHARDGTSMADGLFGAPPIQVVVGEEAHPSLLKALGLLGLGRRRAWRVAVDTQGRMRADQLRSLDPGPTLFALQAGNVNTGAFDPLQSRCDRAASARRLGSRGWRLRPVGGGGAAARASGSAASSTRTRGPPTRTSG